MKYLIKEFLKKDKVERYMIAIVLTILPLITCYAFNDCNLLNIYLPNQGNPLWNDEIIYYKMIGAFAEYNKPLGYFGYNESHAVVGHLGAWSPFLLPAYVLYAKAIGWSLISPIYCNIFMVSVAMLVFACIARPDRHQTVFICVVYFLNNYFSRYTLSAMVENYINMLFLIFFSVSISIFKGIEKEKINIVRNLIILNILAVLMTLARPYFVLLFCIPGYYWYRMSKKRAGIFFQTLISAFCILLYFVSTKYFCAAYFGDIVQTEWLELLFTDTLLGIHNLLKILISSSWQLLRYAGEGMVTGNAIGAVWSAVLAVYFWVYYKWHRENKILWIYCFMYLSLMILAMYYLYNIGNGSRHIATFVFLAIFMVAVFEKSNKLRICIGAIFIWCLCVRASDTYYYQSPVYTAEKADMILRGADELLNCGMIDAESDNPWDNTIIWTWGADFTYLYSIPDGMGISLCTPEYIQANFNNLQPKYIMTGNGGEIEALCVASEKELLAEYDAVRIWKLRE